MKSQHQKNNLLEPLRAGTGARQLNGDPDILSDGAHSRGWKFCHEVDLRLFNDKFSRTLFVADGARELAGVGQLDVEDLQPLFLSVNLQVDAFRLLDFFAVLEPLGDGVALAQLDLEGGLLLAGSHRQGLNLLCEFGRQL